MDLEKVNENRHVLISVHDHDGVRVGFLDNEKPGAIHYYNDSWHRYLTEGSSTFDFTVYKGDGTDVSILNEEAYVSFVFEYQEHLFKIRKLEETETELTCYCESTNLELLNEDSPVYESTKSLTLKEYFELGHLVGVERLSNVVLGTNEVSGVKKKLSWSGTETKLARLLSLVDSFDAECEFVTELNRNGTLNCLKINVYKKHDDDHQGVGTRRVGKTLYYGEGIKTIRRTVDITDIVSSITPTGSKEVEVKTKDENGKETTSKETQTVTLAGYPESKVYDSDDHLLYYVKNGAIWAPQTRDRFPATLTPDSDKWIVQDYSTDGTTQDEVYKAGLERLKVLSEPAIEYEIEGDYDLNIGDTITINDQKFDPPLLLEARVSEQEYCFTDPTQCKNVFSNVKALENKLSSTILGRMQELIDEATPITLEVTIEGATVMKSGSGASAVLTGRLTKGANEIYADSWTWYKDGEQVSTSSIITIDADDISGSSVYRVEAVKGARTYTKTVTMTQVKDGLGITDLKDQYTLSSSTSVNDGSDWSDSTVEYVDGKAVWSRYQITYDDGSIGYTNGVYNAVATIGYQASFRCGALEADSAVIHGSLSAHDAHFTELETDNAVIHGSLSAHDAHFTTLDTDTANIKGTLTAATAILDNLDATYATIESLNATNVSISGRLDATEAVIGNLDATYATIENLSAATGRITNLETENTTVKGRLTAAEAVIDDLDATYATINTLESNYATITNLNAATGRITNLESGKASIGDLEALSTRTGTLEANVGDIGTLISGSTVSGSTQTIVLNAENCTMDTAFLKNLVVANVAAGDIFGDTISTNAFTVKSDDGGLQIADKTIQIKDSSRVRVQIGEDASEDYNLYLWDESGKLLWDAQGLTADAVTRPIIKDSMVSSTANISGSKLNIPSVVTKINDGTTRIESSRVNVNGQSLDVAFNTLETTVDGIEIGGRNLLTNSNVLSNTNGWYYNGSGNTVTKTTLDGVECFYVTNPSATNYIPSARMHHSRIVRFEPNTTYTYSAWIRMNADVPGKPTNGNPLHYQFRGLATDDWSTFNTSGQYTNQAFTITTDDLGSGFTANTWKRVVSHITVGDANADYPYIYFCPYIYGQTGGPTVTELWFRDVKIEKGTMVTDWTPAPEDGEIEIGGRNLLKGTSEPIVITADTITWKYQAFDYGAQPETTYTLSGHAEATAGDFTDFQVYGAYSQNSTYLPLGDFVYTFTTPAEITTGTESLRWKLLIYAGRNGSTAGNELKLTKLQLERGNKATDWTCAPEDTESKISTHTTQISAVQGQISTLISNVDQLSETKADGSTVQTLSTNYSSLKQRVDGIDLSIGSLNTSLTTKADSTTVQTISDNQSTLSTNLDGLSQRVTQTENTLTTKADSSTVQTLSTNYGSLSSTVTGLSSTVGTINSTVNDVIQSTVTIFYASDSPGLPALPTSEVTSTATGTKAWTTAVPTYNASYPYLYTCTQKKTVSGGVSWTKPVHTAYTNYMSGLSDTAKAGIAETVTLFYAKANSTAPSKPTSAVTTNSASTYNAWNKSLPTYSASTPYLYLCTQTKTNGGTYAWTNVVTGSYADFVSSLSAQQTSLTTTVNGITGKVTNLVSAVGANADGTLTTSVVDQISEVRQTASSISQSVTDLQTSFDGLSVGGRNLVLKSETQKLTAYSGATLTFTASQSVSEWNASNAYRVTGAKGTNDIFATLSTGRSASSNPTHTTVSGQAYTHSIYIKNAGGAISVSNALGQSVSVASGETKRVVINGTGNGTNNLQFNFYQTGDSVDLYYWHPKIEKGTMATDWTPAPEDTDSTISGLTSRISTAESKITPSAITLSVTESLSDGSGTLSAGSTFTLTKDACTIDGAKLIISGSGKSLEESLVVDVGGRNLILRSDTRQLSAYSGATLTLTGDQSVSEWGTTSAFRATGTKGTNSVFATLPTGRTSVSDPPETSISGQKYIHSIYVKNVGDPIRVTNNNIGGTETIASGVTKRVVLKGTGTGAYLQFSFIQNGDSVDFYYWHPQIETGTVASEWSPAPEDISVYNIYKSGTTTIDGGKIATGSITASKIDTSDLSVNHVISKNSNDIKTYEIVNGTVKHYAPNSGSSDLISKTTYGYDDSGSAQHQLTLNVSRGFSLGGFGGSNTEKLESYTGSDSARSDHVWLSSDHQYLGVNVDGAIYLTGGTGPLKGIYTSGTVNIESAFSTTSAVTSRNNDSWNCVMANTVSKTAILHFHLNGSFASNTDTHILTINSAYCPEKRVWGCGYTGANPFYINIGTDGKVYVKCGSSALSEIRGTVTWAYGGYETE